MLQSSTSSCASRSSWGVGLADYDLAIVGSGPGGYVSAIRACQLGLKTVIIERAELGGICLNWGCIPSKALLYNAELVSLLERADEFGISFENLKLDYGKAVTRSRRVVQHLTRGVESLLKKNNVTVIRGEAILKDAQTLEIKELGHQITANNIVLATGAHPKELEVIPSDGFRILTSRQALDLHHLPSSVAIIGGGAIGCEFAYLYNAYGVSVTIIEVLPHVLPNEDEDISRHLEQSFSKRGIQILTNTEIKEATVTDHEVVIKVASNVQDNHTLKFDQVLVAVGIQGNVYGIGLENVGVQVENGFIDVSDEMATTVPGIYAIGDVTGVMPLAHVASAQGVMLIERLAGLDSAPLDYGFIPRATYCHPQVASFGLTQRQAMEQGYEVKVGSFPFSASGKALAQGDTDGMVKIVADTRHGDILGAHLIGSQVTELLPELSMVHLLEGTSTEVGGLIYAHPSLAEVVKEAALAIHGSSIHI
jgi:dihydrolipoamide dehydrogenase